jgi:DNA repair exonuclease SbcCD nuclease subunit
MQIISAFSKLECLLVVCKEVNAETVVIAGDVFGMICNQAT